MGSKKKVKRLAVIDCETDPFLHGRPPLPFVWGFYDGERFQSFQNCKDLIDFLAPQHDLIVYAHNGGKFDYFMPGFLDRLEIDDKLTVINGRLAKFKLGDCEFRDSFNILPVPLKAHDKGEIDYKNFEKEKRGAFMPEIMEYLKRDCVSLYTLVKAFVDNYGPKLTLASAAMAHWNGMHAEEPPQSDRAFYHRLRPYYHGGRVEAFRRGVFVGDIGMIDIRSAYPYAMLHEHPISTVPIIDDNPGKVKFQNQGFYRVLAKSRGALIFKDEKRKTTCPDNGETREFFATGWEILAGLETETLEIIKVMRAITFEKTVNFTSYINHFYEMKKKAAKNSPEYIMAKLFLNSLYGKFASDPDSYGNYEVIAKAEVLEAQEATGGTYCGDIDKEKAILKTPLYEQQKRFYNVATAASITGFVRAYLWRNICAIRKAGGDVLYCDTDSIAFIGNAPVDFGENLGQWELEGRFTRGGIAGKKIYAFHNTTTGKWKKGCKGARLTAEQIMEVAAGKVVEWKNDAPTYSIGAGCSFITRKIAIT